MNLVSTPSKWTCLVQWEYFNPKLPNSWHSSVPESPVWIIHWNLTLMNNSFPTFQQKHWFSIPNLPSPSFQPEGSSMVIDTVRSKAPMVSFTKISRWKAAWDWWILEGERCPTLGDLLTMVINHFPTGMKLQVSSLSCDSMWGCSAISWT